jgi:hypothetical protein
LRNFSQLPSFDILEATAFDDEPFELWNLPRYEREVGKEGHCCVININCVNVSHVGIVKVASDGRDASVGRGRGEVVVVALTVAEKKILKIEICLKSLKIKNSH